MKLNASFVRSQSYLRRMQSNNQVTSVQRIKESSGSPLRKESNTNETAEKQDEKQQ